MHPWPVFDEAVARDDQIVIVVQVNGKKRGEVAVAPEAGEDEVKPWRWPMPTSPSTWQESRCARPSS